MIGLSCYCLGASQGSMASKMLQFATWRRDFHQGWMCRAMSGDKTLSFSGRWDTCSKKQTNVTQPNFWFSYSTALHARFPPKQRRPRAQGVTSWKIYMTPLNCPTGTRVPSFADWPETSKSKAMCSLSEFVFFFATAKKDLYPHPPHQDKPSAAYLHFLWASTVSIWSNGSTPTSRGLFERVQLLPNKIKQ